MNTATRDQWIEQCAKQLMALQPVLRPRVAFLAAQDLWEEERGMIPPERRAYLEVVSWGQRPRLSQVQSRVAARQMPRRPQIGRIELDWLLDFGLMVCTVVGIWTWPW